MANEDTQMEDAQEESLEETLLAAMGDFSDDPAEDDAPTPQEEATEVVDEQTQADPIAEEAEQAAPAEQDEPAEPAPSSWRKDVAQKWSDLPAEVRAEVQRRESDYHKSIESYKHHAQMGQEFERVVRPNMDIIQQAGVQPAQALEYLFNAHRTLTQGTNEQKRDAIARIARDCNIDLRDLSPAAPIDPHIQQLMAQNQQLQQFQQQTLAQQQEAVNNEIQRFASDPDHEHFEVVKQDMAAMLQSGMAQDLQDAYEKAVWARADLRQSLVEQQRTEAEKRAMSQAQRQRAKSAAVSVKGSGSSSTGANTSGSIEDTIASAIDGLI